MATETEAISSSFGSVPFAQCSVRASPNVVVAPTSSLSSAQMMAAGIEDSSPSNYVVLRTMPHAKSRLEFAVGASVADLLSQLKTPRLVSDITASRIAQPDEIKKLVLDRILDVLGPNGWCAGSHAVRTLDLEELKPALFTGNARLSYEAVEFGELLQISDVAKLSAKLYFYNRIPVNIVMRRKLPDAAAVLRFVTELAAPSENDWAYFSPQSDRPWHYWRSRWPSQKSSSSFKLYVCPHPNHIQQVFAAIMEGVDGAPIEGFKIPSNVAGLYRPDKIVIYFPDRPTLMQFANTLLPKIHSYPSQPAPFTAEIGNSLLSWGVDPPNSLGQRLGREKASWRTIVCDLLASVIVREWETGVSAAQIALHRIRLEGIDPSTWEPPHRLHA